MQGQFRRNAGYLGCLSMTNEEAKQALMNQTPVMHNGITYQYIAAIIYRRDKYGHIIVSGEMLDRCGTSVVIAEIKNINLKEQKEE